jgi:hypothetical protein
MISPIATGKHGGTIRQNHLEHWYPTVLTHKETSFLGLNLIDVLQAKNVSMPSDRKSRCSRAPGLLAAHEAKCQLQEKLDFKLNEILYDICITVLFHFLECQTGELKTQHC